MAPAAWPRVRWKLCGAPERTSDFLSTRGETGEAPSLHQSDFDNRRFAMSNASTAAVLSRNPSPTPSHPLQIAGANFLNLLIVDDDRIIREACREVAQALGRASCRESE